MMSKGEVKLRPAVWAFAQAMEHKLRLNDHKGGWEASPPGWLLKRLKQEVRELEHAVSDTAFWPDEVMEEAADVANFAMMVADVVAASGEPS